MTLSIRAAKSGDEETILALMTELAEYEKLLHIFHVTLETIRRDYLSPSPVCHCELLFDDEQAVGIATWFFSYATFGTYRKIYLADLFVKPSQRGKGYGKALLAHLARRAKEVGAGQVEWEVLDWNKPSIDFYERIGARAASEWLIYRLGGKALDDLATTAL